MCDCQNKATDLSERSVIARTEQPGGALGGGRPRGLRRAPRYEELWEHRQRFLSGRLPAHTRMSDALTVPLTSLSHGGGCGCKLAPAVLEQLVAKAGGSGLIPRELLVGIETSDDAAVYQISEHQAIV